MVVPNSSCMANASRMATKITPAEWETRKETILNMRRLGVKVKGKGGIVERMKEVYGFTASHHQYELQLGKWDERKYLTAIEWIRTFQFIDQYRKAGQDCQVFMNGKKVEERLLRKKQRLWSKRPGYAEATRVSESDLPRCITVRPKTRHSSLASADPHELNDSPSPSIEVAMAPDETQPTANTVFAVADTDSESYGEEQLEHSVDNTPDFVLETNPNVQSLSSINAFSEPPAFSFPGISRGPISVSNVNVPLQTYQPSMEGESTPEFLQTPSSIGFDTLDPAELAILDLYTSAEPSQGMFPGRSSHNSPIGFDNELRLTSEYSLWQELIAPMGTQPAQLGNQIQEIAFDSVHRVLMPEFDNGVITSTLQSSRPAQLPSSNSSTGSDRTLTNVYSLKSNLAALLPPNHSSAAPLLGDRSKAIMTAFKSPIYRLLISSIENNFAGLEHIPSGEVLKLLKQDSLMRSKLVKYLEQTPKAVATALIEKLMIAAIEDRDAFTVKELLATGLIDPNDIVCSFEGERFTAVERSIMLRGNQVLLAFLDAGADVQKTFRSTNHHCAKASTLLLALQAMNKGGYIDTETVSVLLEHGAWVDVDTFVIAVQLKNNTLIDLLLPSLKEHACDMPETERLMILVSTQLILDVVRNLEDIMASKVLEQVILTILARTLHSDHGLFFYRHPEIMIEATTCAATIGHRKVLEVLLPFTRETAGALAGAIRNGDPVLLQRLLRKCSNVAGGMFLLAGDLIHTTPLAEAIRAQKNELISQFESQAPWSQQDQEPCYAEGFEAALYAASEVGNLLYVRKLLNNHILSKGMATTRVLRYFGPDNQGWDAQISHSLELLSSSLSVSIDKGHEQIALELLNAGARVMPFGRSLCFQPMQYGHPTTRYPALPPLDRDMVIEKHPLFLTLCHRNKHMFDLFLESNIKMDASLVSACLSEAFRNEDRWAIDSLFAIIRYSEGQYLHAALLAAVQTGRKSMVDLAVYEFGCSIALADNSGMESPLVVALQKNDLPMLEYLLQLGVDPCGALDFWKKPEMNLPSKEHLLTVLHAFGVRYPDGIKACGGLALQYAIEQEDIALLDEMLKAKLDVNADDENEYTPLGFAISRHSEHRLEIVGRIIRAGGDANSIVWNSADCSSAIGTPRRTALLEAILTKDIALVTLLIESGAGVNRPARLGLKRTPLQLACEVGCIEIVDLLLAFGAQVNQEPAVRGGATSLQLCSIKGYVGLAIKLLSYGANINGPASAVDGRTCLQGAAENGRLDTISLLWTATGNHRFSEGDCKRAMDLAKKHGHVACRDLIQQLLDADQRPVIPEITQSLPSL